MCTYNIVRIPHTHTHRYIHVHVQECNGVCMYFIATVYLLEHNIYVQRVPLSKWGKIQSK